MGKRGEKTADGKPKPDERTVADLLSRGWFKTEEAAVALLTRKNIQKSRFPYETAKPVAEWLDATLGLELRKGGLLPAAKVVKTFPSLLFHDAAKLQRNWDALTLPTEQGGVGCVLSQEQARDVVLRCTQILNYTTDTLKRGWLMLTATEGGLGLLSEEAQRLVVQNPKLLSHDFERFTQRVELLTSLGYPKAHEMVLVNSAVLNYKEETVREHDAWWKQTGLDYVKILTHHPNRLGAPSTTKLQAALDFLSDVVGLSTTDLNNSGALLHRSLERRLRARYFYTRLKGRQTRFGTINTMMQVKESIFLAMLQGRPSTTQELASDLEVARYQKLVTSAKFVAWRERQEAQLIAGSARTRDSGAV